MNRRNKKLILSFLMIGMIGIVSAYVIKYDNIKINLNSQVSAYVSPRNPQDPAMAPDSYVINFPDANLRTALNQAIAAKTGTARLDTQAINFAEMKTLTGVLNLRNRSIINLEGLQFATLATDIDLGAGNSITSVAPLTDLAMIQSLVLANNQITDITPLQNLTTLEYLDVSYNQNLTSINALANMMALRELDIDRTAVNDLTVLQNKNNLRRIRANRLSNKPNLAPISNLPGLISITIRNNNYSEAEISVLKNAPALTRLLAPGNLVMNLQNVMSGGFSLLEDDNSTFSAQRPAINTSTRVTANPIRGISGQVVPIVETASVKNGNADGTLNPNGEYLVIDNSIIGSGSTTVNWNHVYSIGNQVNEPFSGVLTINYTNLQPDKTPLLQAVANYNTQPSYIQNDPLVAAALAQANNVNAQTFPAVASVNQAAQDLTTAINNAIAAEQHRQNQATIALDNAEIDISPTLLDNAQTRINAVQDPIIKQQLQTRLNAMRTNYQAKRIELQNLIDQANLPATIAGMTTTTITALQTELQNTTTAFTANLSFSSIEHLITNLTTAINNLRADKQVLIDAINHEATQAANIRNNPAVIAALAQANNVNNQTNPSVTDVQNAAQALLDAIQAAINNHTATLTTPNNNPTSTQLPNSGYQPNNNNLNIIATLSTVTTGLIIAIKKLLKRK